MKRMWIDQPSTHQPLHHLHGTNVLAVPEFGNTVRVYFLSGDIVSRQVGALCVSEGWRPDRKTKALELLIAALDDLGFDDVDSPISVSDTVDVICTLYPQLKAAI